MAHEKIIELAKKLKALADRGVGGEKDNADIMLTKLMNKHGITAEMIEGKEVKRYAFRVSRHYYKLFFQIVANVMGKSGKVYRGENGLRYVEATPSDFMEIKCKFDFFLAAYKKEQEVFHRAFVMKNHLYTKVESEDDYASLDDMTPEEKAEWYYANQMAEGMQRQKFHKQIEK